MGITSIVRPYFNKKYQQLRQSEMNADAEQRELLMRMVRQAQNTEWGREHHYAEIQSYEDFQQQVPISTYEEVKGYIDRMRHGEKDVLWPGKVKWYAKSSGTTNDKSKFIPVSKQGLKDTHYAGSEHVVTYYLHNNPKSRLFDGRALILGGSHEQNYDVKESLVGDLSAILIENISPLANLVRVPKKSTALLSDFEIKRDLIAREAKDKNVTNLSGVPSWMLSVLTRLQEVTGKQDISAIWPNLEVFFHGGVAFTPYRERYKEIVSSPNMHYMETYNASEGFFGVQNEPSDTSMLLLTNLGVFYEFIPLEEVGSENPHALPIWEVETDRNYAMVISTTSGLWRYQIGDTVKFTNLRPYKFFISGRTKSFINAFGEELIVDNAEKGLAEACTKTGAEVAEYTAAPVFMDSNGKCRHQWIIDFRKEPQDLSEFAETLDKALQRINSDYEAKRYKDITLQPLEIIKAPNGLFDQWLKSKGKLGGQHKVPRLCNDRKIADEILAMISNDEK
ncbi:MAG: GH3 auxin-responsive promoter family protein [Bacteroidaceae bacterium]|nr:GH3 auxin-responsive promoter family protein [Bacteroidaceae bacterium]